MARQASLFTPFTVTRKGVDLRWLAGLFLVAHGVLHVVIWTMPTACGRPLRRASLAGVRNIRVASIVLALFCGVVLVAAGVGVLAHSGWWPQAAIVGAAGSIVLLLLTFTPWWLLALVIDVAIVVLSWRTFSR
jgi:hypothetical protein